MFLLNSLNQINLGQDIKIFTCTYKNSCFLRTAKYYVLPYKQTNSEAKDVVLHLFW